MPEWFEDESFWQEMYLYLFPDERFELAEEEVSKVLVLVSISGKQILDLACGPGRHSLALARRGYSVTGVDRSSFLLDKGQARAAKSDLPVEWVLEDMRYFSRPDTFDLALSMFTSFGYFDEKGEDRRVLENIYESLKPGGAVVLDVMGKEPLARIFLASSVEELSDGSMLVQQREIFDEWTRIRNKWTLVNEQGARSFTFHHTVYSGQELKDRLLDAGFTEVKLYGDLDGNEYGLNANRLLAVGYK